MTEHLCPQEETEEEYITQKDRNVLFFYFSSHQQEIKYTGPDYTEKTQLPSFPVS